MDELNIDGFVNYKVSRDGEVYSNWSKQWKLKIPVLTKGYKRVQLVAKNRTRKSFTIHRLVALAFIPNPENKPQVNHIDGNKTNNDISNLEWCTASENEIHSHRILGKKLSGAVVTHQNKPGYDSFDGKEVHQYSIDGQYVNSFGSTGEAARSVNGSQGTLYMAISGERKTHKNFRWSFSKQKKLPEIKKKKSINKIKLNQIPEILKLLEHTKVKDISKKFNVSCYVIRDIKHKRRAYKNV